jgi:hypothetical protein
VWIEYVGGEKDRKKTAKPVCRILGPSISIIIGIGIGIGISIGITTATVSLLLTYLPVVH